MYFISVWRVYKLGIQQRHQIVTISWIVGPIHKDFLN
jgi:hypothetical protein